MAAAADRIALAAGVDPRRARRLLADTAAVAQQCAVDPHADLGLGRPHLPEPHMVGAADAAGAARLLRERCEAGLARRGLDRSTEARARLAKELDVICRLQYDTYHLTVAQVVDDVRALGIRVAARGSGAGSMTNYLLGIAAANPLGHNLVFARYLSMRRTDLPDIDLDVHLRTATYDGLLDVADPDTLRQTLTDGIGHGKAYGYGLLTLARQTPWPAFTGEPRRTSPISLRESGQFPNSPDCILREQRIIRGRDITKFFSCDR
ncbi:type I-E CRISPR-associated protein Cas6/Cse3/CasE [Streptomyces sp. B29(2018)]|uniref:type I-E CRISPR-associated protein Cas6/Cse3/CasE n=1 Tax=Streptomyces sp. B29(2018) TaxID=2485016 RepID=UPI0035A2C8A2